MAVTKNRKTGKMAFQSRTFDFTLHQRMKELQARRFLVSGAPKQESVEKLHNLIVQVGLEILEKEVAEAERSMQESKKLGIA